MTEFPYMQLYVADYLADTAHLSAAEHGAYMLLLMNYWQRGSLPIEDRKLAGIARMTMEEWAQAKDTILDFFIIMPDCLRHKRVDSDLAAAREKTQKAKKAGAASAEARKKNAQQPISDCSTAIDELNNNLSTNGEHPFNECSTLVQQTLNRSIGMFNHIEPDPDSELDPNTQIHPQTPEPGAGVCGIVLNLDPKQVRQGTRAARTDGLRDFVEAWNAAGLPPEKRLAVNVVGIADAARGLSSFTDQERVEALANYTAIIKHREQYRTVRPEYGSPYTFLASGIPQYLTASNPWARCGKIGKETVEDRQSQIDEFLRKREATA